MTEARAIHVGEWVMAVADPSFRWAVDAHRVERVVERGAWAGELPVDVVARLGARLEGDADDAARVMVIATRAAPIPVLARGEITVERVGVEACAPVPEILRRAGCADALLGLVLHDSGEATFVVAPERLITARPHEENE